MPDDSGYFGERLNAARSELVRVWKLRSARLQPSFAATDILGALLLASQIFNQERAEHRALVLFSDMRNHTRELNLDSPSTASTRNSEGRTVSVAPVDLHGAKVYALGVDGAGQSTAQWQDLEEYWGTYLRTSGATLEGFSVLREFPGTLATR